MSSANYIAYIVMSMKAKVRDMNKYYGHEMASRPGQRGGMYASSQPQRTVIPTDFGGKPFIVDIAKATINNNTFRTALWSGSNLQLTVMSINPGECIGLEVHPHVDQFLRIEEGCGIVQMGDRSDNLFITQPVYDDSAIFVPAGAWHNLTNTGDIQLKLYSIYAPPNHAFGTVHQTKAIAEASEQ